MKTKVLILLLSVFLINNTFSQTLSPYSIELNTHYYYYFVDQEKYNTVDFESNFSYGFSLLLYRNLGKSFQLGLGLNYATKNFSMIIPPSSWYDEVNYYLKYINIPILLKYKLVKSSKWNISIVNGFIASYIVKYDNYLLYDEGGPKVHGTRPLNGRKVGFTYTIGPEFEKRISSRLMFNLSTYFNYKFVLDYDPAKQNHYNADLYDDRYSLGFKFGVEYLLPYKKIKE